MDAQGVPDLSVSVLRRMAFCEREAWLAYSSPPEENDYIRAGNAFHEEVSHALFYRRVSPSELLETLEYGPEPVTFEDFLRRYLRKHLAMPRQGVDVLYQDKPDDTLRAHRSTTGGREYTLSGRADLVYRSARDAHVLMAIDYKVTDHINSYKSNSGRAIAIANASLLFELHEDCDAVYFAFVGIRKNDSKPYSHVLFEFRRDELTEDICVIDEYADRFLSKTEVSDFLTKPSAGCAFCLVSRHCDDRATYKNVMPLG